MSDLITAVNALEKVSGAYKLLKKIPILRDFLMYREHEERMDQVISEKLVNEYKLTEDPIYQMNFLNSIEDSKLKKVFLAHLIDVKEGRQQKLNLLSTLQIFMNNISEITSEETNDEEMHHDWWTIWQEKARLTSDPLKQKILAEALKREAINAGSIHPRLIRILGDLSVQEINLFYNIVNKFNKNGKYFSFISNSAAGLGDENIPTLNQSDLDILNEAGLINFPSGLGSYIELSSQQLSEDRGVAISFDSYVVIIWTDKTIYLGISSLVTSIGLSLKSLLFSETSLSYLKEFITAICNKLSCKVSIHEKIGEKINKESIYEKN